MVVSPLTGSQARRVGAIPAAKIIELYAPYADVARFFADLKEVSIYECADTGYRFYYPFTLASDGPFYEALAKEELYYLPWKWEHEIASQYIKDNDTVLEFGCADGDFLLEMQKRRGIAAYGAELNETARATAAARGVRFSPVAGADVVCAFEVLEHIADVRAFVAEAVAALRPGGHLIFGVPNNDSFIKDDPTCFLNMPPHHMGLWSERSLRALAAHFPLETVAIHQEPIQRHHFRHYYQVRCGDRFRRFGLAGKVFNKIAFELLARPLIALFARRIVGHTILAVYRKRAEGS
jgi:SAM-dependent methyltransferase